MSLRNGKEEACGGAMTRQETCHADNDGDCDWAGCPQLKDRQRKEWCPLACTGCEEGDMEPDCPVHNAKGHTLPPRGAEPSPQEIYRKAIDDIYNDGEEGRRLVIKYLGTLHPAVPPVPAEPAESIRRQAIEECMAIASECEDDDKTVGAVYMEIKNRLLR